MNADYIEELAFAKLNLNFKIINKLPNNYHKIDSYITFLPCIYDHLTIEKYFENQITISGKYFNTRFHKTIITFIENQY